MNISGKAFERLIHEVSNAMDDGCYNAARRMLSEIPEKLRGPAAVGAADHGIGLTIEEWRKRQPPAPINDLSDRLDAARSALREAEQRISGLEQQNRETERRVRLEGIARDAVVAEKSGVELLLQQAEQREADLRRVIEGECARLCGLCADTDPATDYAAIYERKPVLQGRDWIHRRHDGNPGYLCSAGRLHARLTSEPPKPEFEHHDHKTWITPLEDLRVRQGDAPVETEPKEPPRKPAWDRTRTERIQQAILRGEIKP